ncbi:MAG: prepilin-type N-terminal cleavage/methylation domain-containing protein [Candidatus Thiodiazotropha sp.]
MPNPDRQTSRFPKRADPNIACAGFTLLEMMIALLLLAVISTTSVSMLFLNVKGWERVAENSDEKLAKQLAVARVEQVIRNLIPLIWQQQNRVRQIAFSGDARHVQFIAPAPQQYRPGGLFEYRLALQDDLEQGTHLLLYYLPYQPNNHQFLLPEEGRKRILLSGLENIEFSFFGRLPNRTEPEWTDLWQQLNGNYPELVKITLTEEGMSMPNERIVRIRRNH